MPVIAALLSLLFTKIMLFMGLLFAKKVALVILGVGALVTVSGALYATMRSVIVPLASSLFSTSYGSIIGLAFPPIAGSCILAITTTWTAATLYSYQRTAIKQITSV
jgi:hypothetical protein